ncbi:MAG: serine hydroxymethyltransferase [Oligoflexales bacterium]|nr:serine hydroxymethyltransferase [Oligoflexales bacterium]
MNAKPWSQIKNFDPEVASLIDREFKRQQHGLEMIASENFASIAVITAMANVFTNKYAEGLPKKRYYGGCNVVDDLEELCITRACQLFDAKFANVQPHSGAQANAAAFLALIKPGDKILGLDLSHGGHLTHGSKVNFSGLIYDSHFYQVDLKDQKLNYEEIEIKAKELKPKLIIAGASAYPRTIDFAKFRKIADSVGAFLLVDMAHIAGLVAAGLHPSPMPHAHVVTTTTHKTLRGPRGGLILWNDPDLTAQINKAVFPGTQGGPLEHIIAAKAVCFKEALQAEFKTYQQQVIKNARVLADQMLELGFSLVSGGTDNHLVLLDLSKTDVSGKDLDLALGKVEITVNKNTVPNETRSPFVTSGVRFGTPALTSRGFGEAEMKQIANFVFRVFNAIDNTNELARIREEVLQLAKRFPLYPEWIHE